jgi:hypothetical protein
MGGRSSGEVCEARQEQGKLLLKAHIIITSQGWKESEITEQQMAQICDALRDELRRTIPAHVKQVIILARVN